MSINVVCLLIFIIQTNRIFSQNNRVRSPDTPLNLPKSEIPMFLTITVDDALHSSSHAQTDQILGHFNPNSEQIPLVYFVSNEFTDYRSVQARYLQGCEIAVHTVTHSTREDTSMIQWYHEIQTSRDLLSVHADIPFDEIIGFRAPFLEKNDFSYDVLHGINPVFTYDSTVAATLDNDGLFDWPYTLDEYEVGYFYRIGEGPVRSYPGLWEIPMYDVYTNISSRDTIGQIMDYTGDYDTLLDAFKTTFLHRLQTNKAPMGLYFHSIWLDTQSNVDALNDFISWALAWDNTWIVTNKEIINWINSPVTISQNYDFRNTNQLISDKTAFHKCEWTDSFIYTVETFCPNTNPHALTWDAAQPIDTQITVSSTDNELRTVTEMCANDTYTAYDMNTAYCATEGVTETVRYMNNLYTCLWWTQTGIPGIDTAWILTKDCMPNVLSFTKGSIAPYGTFNVFENNELEINMQINNAFRLLTVAVIVDNNYYDLGVFDRHSLVYNSLTDVTLSIQFGTINLVAYEIEVSFRDANTSQPTAAPSKSPTMSPSQVPSTPPTPFPSKFPSTSPTQYPTRSPSMPSSSPTRPPTEQTGAPSQQPSAAPTAPTANPSMRPTEGVVKGHGSASDKDSVSLTLSYAMLAGVLGAILCLIAVCCCSVCLVMKNQKKQMMKEFEDNIVHTVRVQSGSFPATSMMAQSVSTQSIQVPPPINTLYKTSEI